MNPSDLTAIKRALVKIWFKSGEDSFFKGTGFFIHSDGYLLTAYHCIKDCKNNIVVESLSVGKKRAVVVPELSLPGADIAVLQLSDPSMENTVPFYLPLGTITDTAQDRTVRVLGYPQPDASQVVAEPADYPGYINRLFKEGENFLLECQAIVGQGQSGSPVYHPVTQRVVAMVRSMYDKMHSGDAVRFEQLFQSHPKLNSLNQKSELVWEQQLITTDREILQQQQEELQRLRLQREHGERELAQQRAEIERKRQEEITRLKQVQEQREIEKHESEQQLVQQEEELQRLQLQLECEEQELVLQRAEIERKQQEKITRLKQVQEQKEVEKHEGEQKLAQQQDELQRLQLQLEREEQELVLQRAEIERKQQEKITRLKQVQEQKEVEKHEGEQKLAQQQDELQRLQLQREQEELVLVQQRAEIEQKQWEETAQLKQLQEQKKVEKREWECEVQELQQRQVKEAKEQQKFGELFEFDVITVDNVGKEVKRVRGKSYQKIYDLGRGIKLELVHIPAGKFMMGSADREGDPDEHPRHKVTFVKPFYMGKYPVTQEQWQAVMGNNPSYFKCDKCPVETVSWNDAKEFCKKLSQRLDEKLDLPSEAAWEYACRAGTTTKYNFGDVITPQLANYIRNIGQTTEVGRYSANRFGLYDMHGNVWEWCEDVWHENYNGAPRDGSAWIAEGGSRHLFRGGSWYSNDNFLRCAFRGRDATTSRDYVGGFRISKM